MNKSEFKILLSEKSAPDFKDTILLKAVWYLMRKDWESAHKIVQDEDSETASWIHGLIHRIEGDLSNARYWYRNAGRKYDPDMTIEDESELILDSLIKIS